MIKGIHTPGPWTVQDSTTIGKTGEWKGKVIGTYCLYSDNLWLGSFMPYGINGFTDAETAKHNATLAAAAPDLLEALIEVVRLSDKKHDAWDKAKEAIKKATI